MPILYNNTAIHINVVHNHGELRLSVGPAAAQRRAALEAPKTGEDSASLRQDSGALVVHLAARLDETHAAAAVGHATAAPGSPLE
uniref:Uncharacterized protein n=1 Tax=Arundo donax TaxID=35708 RepID=A0A0A9HTF3_ARUDO